MNLNVQFEKFLDQKIIGYQRNAHKVITHSVMECIVQLKDGSIKKCWASHPIDLVFSNNLVTEKPPVDIVL